MKIGLLHNPDAGHGERTIAELTRLFKEAGHEVVSASTKGKRWKELLAEPIERVIISGGDGTVSKVAPLLVGKNLPFHILPLGTANNIARCLDQIQSVERFVSAFDLARLRTLDLGRVAGIPGRKTFVEAVGIGVLVKLMEDMASLKEPERANPGKRLAHALDHCREISEDYAGVHCQLFIDDQKVFGRFLLVEVMNTTHVGPGLALAPNADPADGFMEVVCVRDDQREQWCLYLDQLRSGADVAAPFEARTCRRAEFISVKAPVHADSKIGMPKGRVRTWLEPGALQFFDLGDK
jgi:diacylglycerol kinase (ATP)